MIVRDDEGTDTLLSLPADSRAWWMKEHNQEACRNGEDRIWYTNHYPAPHSLEDIVSIRENVIREVENEEAARKRLRKHERQRETVKA